MIPFCISASSDVGQSDRHLEEQACSVIWLKGTHLQGNISEEALLSWISEKIKE
jgi:hypothetical protein